jgi:hypothetical protein
LSGERAIEHVDILQVSTPWKVGVFLSFIVGVFSVVIRVLARAFAKVSMSQYR